MLKTNLQRRAIFHASLGRKSIHQMRKNQFCTASWENNDPNILNIDMNSMFWKEG